MPAVVSRAAVAGPAHRTFGTMQRDVRGELSDRRAVDLCSSVRASIAQVEALTACIYGALTGCAGLLHQHYWSGMATAWSRSWARNSRNFGDDPSDQWYPYAYFIASGAETRASQHSEKYRLRRRSRAWHRSSCHHAGGHQARRCSRAVLAQRASAAARPRAAGGDVAQSRHPQSAAPSSTIKGLEPHLPRA